MKKKYIKSSCIAQLKSKPCNSPMWNDLLKGRRMLIGNGKMSDFWEDAWCGDISLKRNFPELYKICREKNLTVDKAAREGWRLSLRRWLDEDKQDQ